MRVRSVSAFGKLPRALAFSDAPRDHSRGFERFGFTYPNRHRGARALPDVPPTEPLQTSPSDSRAKPESARRKWQNLRSGFSPDVAISAHHDPRACVDELFDV